MKVSVVGHDKLKNTSYIVCSDIHEGHSDKKSIELMNKYAQVYNIENIILLGDVFDFDWLMPKNPSFKKWIKRGDGVEEFFLPKFEESMLWAIDFFCDLKKIFKNIYFVFGNHDERINEFREQFCLSEYRHHFHIEERLKDYVKEFFGNNCWLDIGSLSMIHGQFCGPSHFKKHYEASEARNVLIGHVHKSESMCFISRGKTKRVRSLGCMSTLNPVYMKNRDNNWTLGFAHLIVKPNGHFHLYDIDIFDDEICCPDGRVIK